MSASGSHNHVSSEALHQAAEWLVKLNDEAVTDADRQAWQYWLNSSTAHACAWQRAERLRHLFSDVPSAIGASPLRRYNRRAAIRAITGILLGVPVAYAAWQQEPWQYALADYVSGVGQQKQVWLEDGSSLLMNTDTRVTLQYRQTERRLILHRGEVLIQTAPDTQIPDRPFMVETRYGHLQALGTRFAVRLFDNTGRLAVEEGAVKVSPSEADPMQNKVIQANQQVMFNTFHVMNPLPLQRQVMDWSQGLLFAQSMPLGEVIAELARYRRGVLRCDPAVAAIPVSGVFQLADTDTALALLQQTFPVTVHSFSRLWVVVGAA